MHGKTARAAALMLASAVMIFAVLLSGCGKKGPEPEPGYKIDFCGQESSYEGVKDRYLGGEVVTLYFGNIEENTDYEFLLDGVPLLLDYDSEKGYIVSFIMPGRDVKLEYTEEKTEAYLPQITPDILLIDYCRADTAGGDSSYEISLSTCTSEEHKLVSVVKSSTGGEKVTEYRVPTYSSERCYRAIYETELIDWDKKECTESEDGVLVVVKYRSGENYVRASNEQMPPGGRDALEAVRSVLEGYMTDEYRVDGK